MRSYDIRIGQRLMAIFLVVLAVQAIDWAWHHHILSQIQIRDKQAFDVDFKAAMAQAEGAATSNVSLGRAETVAAKRWLHGQAGLSIIISGMSAVLISSFVGWITPRNYKLSNPAGKEPVGLAEDDVILLVRGQETAGTIDLTRLEIDCSRTESAKIRRQNQDCILYLD